MRDIKFKIWADNKWYDKCLVGNTNNIDDDKWTCPLVWLEDKKEWVHCDNGVICQYTGLKDKNGKEIYEGDIVKANWFDKTEVIGEIYFSMGCFILANSSVSDNQLFIFKNLEVIGNVWEDSDLLNDSKNTKSN